MKIIISSEEYRNLIERIEDSMEDLPKPRPDQIVDIMLECLGIKK